MLRVIDLVTKQDSQGLVIKITILLNQKTQWNFHNNYEMMSSVCLDN